MILHILPYPLDADSKLLFVSHACAFVSHDGIPPTISYPFAHLSQILQGHYLQHLILNVVRGIFICLLAQPHTKLRTVYTSQLKKLQEIAICICPNSPQWQTLTSQKLNALKDFQQHPPVGGFLLSVCLTKELSNAMNLLWESNNSLSCFLVTVTALVLLEGYCCILPMYKTPASKSWILFCATCSKEFPIMISCQAQMTEGCVLPNIVVQPWEWLTPFCPEWSCSFAKCALRKGEAFVWMELHWKLWLWRCRVHVPAVRQWSYEFD